MILFGKLKLKAYHHCLYLHYNIEHVKYENDAEENLAHSHSSLLLNKHHTYCKCNVLLLYSINFNKEYYKISVEVLFFINILLLLE